jgi:hypothetical protein
MLCSPARRTVTERVVASFPSVPTEIAALEHGYYHGVRAMISAEHKGRARWLIDVGAFDWLQKLLSNRRMALVASAIGSQLAVQLFRTPQADKG